MSETPFEDFLDGLDYELMEESDAINVIRYCSDDDECKWHLSANKPKVSGRYILYLSDDQNEFFTWVGKYNSISKEWEVRLPFRVAIRMWRLFPKQPGGHKHGLFILDEITGTIGGTLEVVRE